MSKPSTKLILIIVALLAVPVLPFIFFGSYLEPWVESFFNEQANAFSIQSIVALIISVLAVDILLPIPSSVVCTFAGKELGGWVGTLVSWTGLNLSAALGYWIGSKFGLPVAKRFADDLAIAQIEKLDHHSSIICLIVCRGLPIVAEASVLFMGVKRLPWRVFWPAVLVSNLGLAAAYCALGSYASQASWFPLAVGISLSIPILFLLFWARFRKRNQPSDSV